MRILRSKGQPFVRNNRNAKTHKGSGKDSHYLLLLCIPAILWFVVFSYLPMFGVAFAFKQFTPRPGQNLIRNLFVNSRWTGLDNFSFLVRSSQISEIMFNTIFYNVVFIILGITIPVLFAMLLAEVHGRSFSGIIQMVLLLPYFLSWVIVGYCLYGFLATDEGQVNHILLMLGKSGIQWYQSPQYWRVILIATGLWKSMGYSMIIYLCAITSIDRTLYESATLDGAGFWAKAKYITLPMLRPTIATIFILHVGSILSSDFGLFYQIPLDSNSLQPVTQTLDVYVYKALMQQANFSYSSAASFLQSSVGCVLLLIAHFVIKKLDRDR